MSEEHLYPWAERLSPHLLKSPWWIGHIPFAFELVGRLRPRVLVELGTYSGSSFAAFCQAAEACGAPMRCYGIDLWEGDIHMGRFDEALFNEIHGYVSSRYPSIANLVRKDFNDAAADFADGSVDLLHIDGTHTFEAVSNDFNTWLPKMSDRSVVLFHDVNVNMENTGPASLKFGVRKVFDGVKHRYPHFEFDHCWGLGVLVTGANAPGGSDGAGGAVAHAGVRRVLRAEGRAGLEALRGHERAAAGARRLCGGADLAPRGEQGPSRPAPAAGDRAAMTREHAVRLIAMYFPQLHPIPENDAWWGKGFTDWVNVRTRAAPVPRPLPAARTARSSATTTSRRRRRSNGRSTIARNSTACTASATTTTGSTASSSWSARPTSCSSRRSSHFPFCLAWANETWSRRWDGRDHHILQEQTHHPDEAIWQRHFEYLFRAWSDDRAIKVDGKPVFLVYRAHRIQEIGAMFDFWREEAHRRGLPGLYLVSMKQYEFPVPDVLKHFDAIMQFQPFEAIYSPDFAVPAIEASRALAFARMLPERVQDVLRAIRYHLFSGLTFYDYDLVWQQILKVEREAGLPCFPGRVRRLGQHGALPEARAHLQGRLAGALLLLVPPARAGDGAASRARAADLPQRVERVGRRHLPRARRALRQRVPRGGA